MTDHQDAIERKRRSERVLAEQGLPVLDALPCLASRSMVRPRTQEEAVHRSAAVAAIYYRTGLVFLADLDDFMRDEALYSRLTPEEKQFYFCPDVREHPDFARYTWRLEAFHVLLWALGHFDRIEAPDVPVDTKVLYHHFFAGDFSAFREGSRLRRLAPVLDAADLYFRYYEVIRHHLRRGMEAPRGLILEIVRERYIALLWLLGRDGWDALQRTV